MAVAPSLECRMLAAARCSYEIDPSGIFTPLAPYYDAVGFVDPPTPIVGGTDEIDACLVGRNGDGIIVAFRGTLPPEIANLPSLLDWIQDFEADLQPEPGITGRVHSGFWNGLDGIWVQVLAAVQRLSALDNGRRPIYVTGHSKGGALSHLAAMRLLLAKLEPAGVYAYAAPRVGDAAFAAAYDQAISAIRYEYQDDIVPHLPPDIDLLNDFKTFVPDEPSLAELQPFDYADVGTLRFINWENQIEQDTDWLQRERRMHLAWQILRGNIEKIIDDHGASCGDGYMEQVCTGLCPT